MRHTQAQAAKGEKKYKFLNEENNMQNVLLGSHQTKPQGEYGCVEKRMFING